MILSVAVLALLTLQRIGELVLDRRNRARLIDRGGAESGGRHYPVMVALHGAWLILLWVLVIAQQREITLPWVILLVSLQGVRAWVVATLGERWTTRVIALPGAARIASGPYRLMAHPNYLVVVAEIALTPLAFGLPLMAAVFSLANAAMLYVRIGVEDRALAETGAAGL